MRMKLRERKRNGWVFVSMELVFRSNFVILSCEYYQRNYPIRVVRSHKIII